MYNVYEHYIHKAYIVACWAEEFFNREGLPYYYVAFEFYKVRPSAFRPTSARVVEDVRGQRTSV